MLRVALAAGVWCEACTTIVSKVSPVKCALFVSVQLGLKVAIGVESDPYPPCSTGAVATRACHPAYIGYSNRIDLVLADMVQSWEGTKL